MLKKRLIKKWEISTEKLRNSRKCMKKFDNGLKIALSILINLRLKLKDVSLRFSTNLLVCIQGAGSLGIWEDLIICTYHVLYLFPVSSLMYVLIVICTESRDRTSQIWDGDRLRNDKEILRTLSPSSIHFLLLRDISSTTGQFLDWSILQLILYSLSFEQF